MKRLAERAQADKQRRNSRAAEEKGAVAEPLAGPVPIEAAASKPTESDPDETRVSHRSESQRVSIRSGICEDLDEPRASHRSEGLSSARGSNRSGTLEEGRSPRLARTPTHESENLENIGRTPSHQSSKSEKVLKSLPTQQTFSLKDYSTIESLDSGAYIIAQRKKLLDAVPELQPKVDVLIRQAEKEFNAASKIVVEEAVTEVAQAQSIADQAKSLATKSGVPPDHPDFTRVVQVEEKLDGYMSEAVRLHKLSQGYKTEIQRWRAQVEDLSAQRPGLLNTFKKAKRENHLFQAIGAPETSFSSRAEGARGGSLKPLTKLPKGSVDDVRTSAAPMAPRTSAKTSAAAISGVHTQLRLQQDQAPHSAREPRGALQRLSKGSIGVALPTAMPAVPKGIRSDQSRDATFSPSSSSGLSSPGKSVSSLALPRAELQEHDATNPRDTLAPAEAHYLQEIRQLEAKVKNAKQEVRKLQGAQCKGIVRTGWLEEFFLLCMDDVRKEFHRRKHCGAAKSAASRPYARETLGGHSPQRSDSHLSSQHSSDCSQGAPRTDVLDVVFGAEDLSSFLFEKMFPHRGAFFSIKRRDGGLAVTGGVRAPAADGVASIGPLPPLPSFEQASEPPPPAPLAETVTQLVDWRRMTAPAHKALSSRGRPTADPLGLVRALQLRVS